MKNLSAVILLCNAAWMTIYLYGEYTDNSVKFHSSLIIFPILFFAIVLILFFSSTLQMSQKNITKSSQD